LNVDLLFFACFLSLLSMVVVVVPKFAVLPARVFDHCRQKAGKKESAGVWQCWQLRWHCRRSGISDTTGNHPQMGACLDLVALEMGATPISRITKKGPRLPIFANGDAAFCEPPWGREGGATVAIHAVAFWRDATVTTVVPAAYGAGVVFVAGEPLARRGGGHRAPSAMVRASTCPPLAR
jgi:hypothetical protein